MNKDKDQDYLQGLVAELRKLPAETSWVEFKENNDRPEDIGEYLSALSNAAALDGKSHAYLIWGVRDKTHEVVGTSFRPNSAKKGNEDLENWLLRQLSPRLHFRWYEFEYEHRPMVLLEIPRASVKPTQFSGVEYLRVGSYRQKLKDYPEHERELWRIFDTTPFEDRIAIPSIDASEVLSLIDYPLYFELLRRPLPTDRDKVLAGLADEHLVVKVSAKKWDITNLGAVLFAKDLGDFRALARKSVRVVVYEGRGRRRTIREKEATRGYAAGFGELLDFINALLPSNEVMGRALRKNVPMYPELAVRELVANAIIHQDFAITGSGPMVEIFEDRMEITNPGLPLVTPNRFLDTPPRSRNESLASLLRRAGICEERGSGVDKIVFETEFYQLPAPLFETFDESTRSVLFAQRSLNEMDRADRVRACYLHACLRCVEREPMTNSSLRERFGIEKQNSAVASRIIKESLEEELIRPFDPQQGKKHAKYLPFWS